MHRSTTCLAAALVIAAASAACNGDNKASGTAGTTTPAKDSAAATTGTAAKSTKVEPSAEKSATPSPSASASTSASASSSTGAAPPNPPAPGSATATNPVPGKKKYNCGAKGQKACPMQGWMRGVMGRAMQSNDKDKIAKALQRIAAKPPAGGYPNWSSIAATGAAQAAAGNIDGAKAACKKCHAAYQKKYIANHRDRPW